MKRYADFPMRISRGDSVAPANRDRDYVVHAARPARDPYRVVTACGRVMWGTNTHAAFPDTHMSCMKCVVATGGDPKD